MIIYKNIVWEATVDWTILTMLLVLIFLFITPKLLSAQNNNSTKETYYTKVIYVIPKDRSFNQKYANVLKKAVLEVQEWYRKRTLNGTTFHLESDRPIVDTLHLPHDGSWYSKQHAGISGKGKRFWGYNNTRHDFFEMMPDVNTDRYVYIIYIDADLGGGGAGTAGFTALGVKDIRGLEGLDKMPRSRWVGGMGHAFELSHPPKFTGKYLMGTGYSHYPNIDLIKANKQRLKNGKRSQFFY